MDIESLEAANQSLQVDLKLAFKRIGDLQAAIEDEMESDDNDDLINRYVRAFFASSCPFFSKLRPETRVQPSYFDTVNQTGPVETSMFSFYPAAVNQDPLFFYVRPQFPSVKVLLFL